MSTTDMTPLWAFLILLFIMFAVVLPWLDNRTEKGETQKMKLELITTEQLVNREWRTGISNREELNAMGWDELIQAIGVSISDDVNVECTDTYYDSLHNEYVVSFSIME